MAADTLDLDEIAVAKVFDPRIASSPSASFRRWTD
jgi:hypothetical protein